MTVTDKQGNTMLDILRNAFPGRADDQIAPIGLIYAGVRWGKDYRYWCMSGKDDEEIDEDDLRQEYTRVAAEMQERQRLCPSVHLADLPWRTPLSIAVQKAATPNDQAEIVAVFYEAFNKYVM